MLVSKRSSRPDHLDSYRAVVAPSGFGQPTGGAPSKREFLAVAVVPSCLMPGASLSSFHEALPSGSFAEAGLASCSF